MSFPGWLILAFALAALDWVGVERGWRRLRFISKPGALLALIVWFTLAVGWGGTGFWFGLALFFSLLGDVNLLFPARFFLPGLVSFLLAHLAYIIGFTRAGLPANPLAWLILVGVAAAGAWVFSRISAGLSRTDAGRKLLLPVSVYSIAISLMLASAWLRLFQPSIPPLSAACSAAGATLFFISDSVLAYNRFVRLTPHHDLLVMSTYHLGQFAIIAGLTF